MIVEEIRRFVADPRPEAFEELALGAFAFQYERIEPYRRLCDGRGATPAEVSSWREIPPVPAVAFKSLELAAAPAVEIFRSSGTTGGPEARSVHYHPFPDLYRQVIDTSFPRYCLARLDRPPMLSLVPSREQLPDSSLAFMVEHALERFGGPGSAAAFGRRGVDLPAARSWAGARQRDGRPVLILGTALALDQLAAGLERLGLRFRLPAGSAVFETGGFKGRERELTRGELLARLDAYLGVPASSVVSEYGMTELTSQCYTETLRGGPPEIFVAPPWVRVRILDPETLEEAAAGAAGLVAVTDLANVGSAVSLLTEDLGRTEGEGFRLLGRAAGAELRGCSLTAEEMAAGGGS